MQQGARGNVVLMPIPALICLIQDEENGAEEDEEENPEDVDEEEGGDEDDGTYN